MRYLEAPYECVLCPCVLSVRWPISPLSSWLWPFKERVRRRGDRESCKLCWERRLSNWSFVTLETLLAPFLHDNEWAEDWNENRGKSETSRGRLIRLARGEGRWLGIAGVVQTISLMLVETSSRRIRGNEIKQRNISFFESRFARRRFTFNSDSVHIKCRVCVTEIIRMWDVRVQMFIWLTK